MADNKTDIGSLLGASGKVYAEDLFRNDKIKLPASDLVYFKDYYNGETDADGKNVKNPELKFGNFDGKYTWNGTITSDNLKLAQRISGNNTFINPKVGGFYNNLKSTLGGSLTSTSLNGQGNAEVNPEQVAELIKKGSSGKTNLGGSGAVDEEFRKMLNSDGTYKTKVGHEPWITKSFNEANYNLEGFLNAKGLTYNRLLSRILNINSINKNKVTAPTEFINFGKAFIFFTKPDLFLFTPDGDINPSIKRNAPDLYVKIMRNKHVAKALQSEFTFNGVNTNGKGFINLLGNFCTSLESQDISLSARDTAKTIREHAIRYGGDFYDSLTGQEVSISFMDTRDRDVSTLIEIWTEYIEAVSLGKVRKKQYYIENNIIDYAISIYIFILDETNNIVAHTMMTGCYPRQINTQLLSYRREIYTAETFVGPFSYTWQATFLSKPNSHSTIERFNYVSGFSDIRDAHNLQATYGVDYAQAYKNLLVSVEGEGDNVKPGKFTYMMHNSIEPWGYDIIRYNKDLEGEPYNFYQHQLTITDYFPESAGVVMTPTSSQVIKYSLIFYSSKPYLTALPINDYSNLINYEQYYFKDKQGNKTDSNLIDLGSYFGLTRFRKKYTLYWANYKAPIRQDLSEVMKEGDLFDDGVRPKAVSSQTETNATNVSSAVSASAAKNKQSQAIADARYGKDKEVDKYQNEEFYK